MPTIVTTVTVNRFPQLIDRMRRQIENAVEETAKEIEQRIKLGMMEPHSGRWYGKHRASAPGEMPAAETGNLVNSIQTDPDGDATWAVWTGVEYAVHLEYGAPNANIAPRPFMRPATADAADGFERRLRNLESQL